MMAAPTLQPRQRQQQVVTPRLQHAVRLLQLSSLDFAQEVMGAMGRNPFLEVEEPLAESTRLDGGELASAGDANDFHESGDAGDLRRTAHDGEAADRDFAASDGSDASDLGDPGWERDNWQQSGTGTVRRASEGEVAALDLIAADIGLRQHLRSQLDVLPLEPRDHALACAIVESLDDDGYLRSDIDEIADTAGMTPAVEPEEMRIALCRVQALDPAGIGARSVAECLTLQLGSIACESERALCRRIIEEHLPRLAQRDVQGLAKRLGATPAEIEAACDRIRRLDPRPGWKLGAAATQYIVPDVLVRKVRGQWVATLNSAIVPRVRLNQSYATLFQRHRQPGQAELAQHLQDARWTVKNVEQRFSTILQVAEAILARQHHFLEFGPMAMKPLGLKEIAEELGLHESTVSRVTNNKYMATPAGVFELKYFFSRQLATANGGACSATAIRGVIQGMIEGENPAEPLSDAQIARLLVRQGLRVARRTVTKYRQLLKVPPVDRRRRLPGLANGLAS
jgi:RNA polymerase sigma-54 factor